ncbi:AraC family transcriptional regulator [Pseudomonas sp. UME83]|jgi:transcriptional regulator GlxA family with amidase domain|nr:AraC family transcriptional regulator [Pseudomonas sp. UMC76]MBB1641219.1 AraC family transcriptional regulator [Pseudomonas sp. UME83]NTX92042.1 GlxA family transcriptional regulator [Pseudomonas sp. UMA643]NTY21941.1 GlxA family transcriptional regulator [Pseudomonas sp. UMC3103]NTY26533.1 GlxA family transcriptional regulator [Pseudomonas sp. UMA603]NTY33112.1 GlxA family transcriptional regulator [Pseudomonas sp. UMC3129]NTY54491.1 GlxA family transcriptional regulator [Pseudomonas sp.
MQGKNLRFMAEKKAEPQRQRRVGFVLLEHFSLPAFTQALDTLVTANLIREGAFSTHTFSLDGEPVTSDLGLVICPSAALESRHLDLDLLVVCGGLRTPLRELPSLNRLLQLADDRGVDLAGLWNGAWFLGKAGLLDCHKCAVHPENRAALAEVARNSVVTAESYIVDGNRLTAGSPAGAFNMVLEWINRLYGRELVDGVVDILAFEESRYRRTRPALHEKMSQPLRDVLNLMSANIEEPLSTDQLSQCVGRSKRQLERLFQEQLGTSPVRYYLELRITESRRLLQHSDLSLVEAALACGFVSPSHFSKCYTSFFGYPPSKEIRHGCVRSARAK